MSLQRNCIASCIESALHGALNLHCICIALSGADPVSRRARESLAYRQSADRAECRQRMGAYRRVRVLPVGDGDWRLLMSIRGT